jgi:hypothetical protein
MPTATIARRRSVNPWLIHASKRLIKAVLAKEIASQLSGPLKGQITKHADDNINEVIDEYCGTIAHSPRHPKRSLPGPRGEALELAILVAALANTSGTSEPLRSGLMEIAANLTKNAYAADGLTQ